MEVELLQTGDCPLPCLFQGMYSNYSSPSLMGLDALGCLTPRPGVKSMTFGPMAIDWAATCDLETSSKSRSEQSIDSQTRPINP